HGFGLFELFTQTILMAAGKMAGFVSDNTDNLIRGFRLEQGTGIDKDAPSVDKSVEARAVDQNCTDTLFTKACGIENWG
ncbi:hypothetical protein NSP61_25515, partial [Salmonella enterica]|nr:hypothetical protein [Salmonella enterica]